MKSDASQRSIAPSIRAILLSALLLIGLGAAAQPQAVADNFCFIAGQTFGPQDNVLFNDILPPQGQTFVLPVGNIPCLHLMDNGSFVWSSDGTSLEDCCGTYTIFYQLMVNGEIWGEAPVTIEIKCPKPDCNLIDLNPYLAGDDPVGGGNPGGEPLPCVSVCEFSDVTFFVDFNPTSQYIWNVVSGGTGVIGANDAEYIVSWGAQGPGFISITIIDAGGNSETFVICVDILPAPIANFTAPASVCLGQSFCFTNLSTPVGSSVAWDFGDGNTSNMWAPCHQYSIPGTYTVTLTVTNQNNDAQGNPLCCCTDVFTFDIVVDALPGPSIFCISTLCQGDSDCYSTDATNCSSYIWTVLDANGNDITGTITGQGTNQICVTWPIGPFGTITLDVSGCDATYCPNPTSVTVPVISNSSQVSGPIIVCAYSTETYSVPKWLGTTYSWNVGGGAYNGTGTGNLENITWGAPGTGTITVNYTSTFLGGLPGQDPVNCQGVATLSVLILPEFTVTNGGPASVCVGSTSNIGATATPNTNYNWTVVDQSNNAHPFTGQGTANISILWAQPGAYLITATNNTGAYCNTSESTVIIVQNVPMPLGIDGPLSICPADTSWYSVLPSGPGYAYLWSAIGGVLTATNGATVGVVWGAGGGTLTVQQVQTTAPYCPSLPFTITVIEKGPNGPYILSGGPTCTNDIATYTLTGPAHPDVDFTWTLSDPTKGSILSGQGTNSISVQWGNIPQNGLTVSVDAELCGNIVSNAMIVNLTAPQVPVITQSNAICEFGPGSATLTATAGFATYTWNPGPGAGNTLNISAGGTYALTTIDNNGCTATVNHVAVELPAPESLISSPDPQAICTQFPHNVNMFAQTNGNWLITWSCNFNGGGAVVVQGPSINASYTHIFQNVPGNYAYTLHILDPATGCENTWGTFNVTEGFCDPTPPCTPDPYLLVGSATQQGSFCDTYQFNYTGSGNFTFSGWNFGDLSGSALPNPTHTYNNIGYFTAQVCGLVPEAGVPGNFCTVCRDVPVVVPLKAKFSLTNDTCGVYDILDLSTFLAGAGNAINSWLWTSSDGHSSASPTPGSFTFVTPGPKTITLLVGNSNGCQSQFQINFNFNGMAAPVIVPNIASACVNDPIPFSASAPGAISYLWSFGDGGTYLGQSVSWAYDTPSFPGTYNLSVTVSDALGCMNNTTIPVTVYPVPADGDISGDLSICQGSQTTLTANVDPTNGDGPYSYLWQPGLQTTPTINVGQGTYSVTVTNIYGCVIELGPVEVVELPLPLATITGDLFICDAGCTTLSVPFDSGNTYQWFDDLGNPIPFQTSNQIYICDFNLLAGYSVEVTDQNGCTNSAGPVVVQVVVSPDVTISTNPNPPLCAGTPITLTATSTNPNATFAWSTGASGPSITVTQAGSYTVVATDPLTGCTGNDSVVINPLPDLCIVPVGCYEVCNPDTICGPDGLIYLWTLNNLPFSTDQCIIITQSGTYNLTATNQFGCSVTSGDLVLTVIECPDSPCDELVLESAPVIDNGVVSPCCLSLSYTNNLTNIQGLSIWTNDGGLVFSGIDPALNVQSLTGNSIALGGMPAGSPIPQGSLPNFVTFCVQNAITSPQTIIIDWYDLDDAVVCSDTLTLNCPVEPPCLYVTNDSIYCENELINYTFTVCNPSSNTFNIGFIDILVMGPAGVVLTPPNFDITGSPILPGTCQTFTIQLSGVGIEGQQFCYTLIGHETNPFENPGGLCCPMGDLICIDIPVCDPCPHVGIEGWVPTSSPDGCCFDVWLYNNFQSGYFDEIGVNVISPLTTITTNNPFGSGWTTSNLTPTSLSFLPDAPVLVPSGPFVLPELCVQTSAAPMQQIELTWMKDGVVICRDTLAVSCDPPCGYIPQHTIDCDPVTGNWTVSGQIMNTSGQTINSAFIEFTSPAGLGIYNTTVALGATLPNTLSAPFNFVIGVPAQAGDTVCFTVTLHSLDSDGNLIECCQFTDCIVLPPCDQEVQCECGPEFVAAVLQGFTATTSPGNPLQRTFSMNNSTFFGDCDLFVWTWGHNSPATITNGPASVIHTFPGIGTYNVCVRVTRTLPDGTECKQHFCMNVVINGLPPVAPPAPEGMVIYPNPSDGQFALKMFSEADYPISFSVIEFSGRTVAGFEQKAKPESDIVTFDLGALPSGVYVLYFTVGQDVFTRKVIIE